MAVPGVIKEPLTFFNLPLELRNNIYGYAFPIHTLGFYTILEILAKSGSSASVFQDRTLPRALLLVNKQVNAEASQCFSDNAVYHLYSETYIPSDQIDRSNDCAHIKHLKKELIPFTDPRIKHWDIRVLFQWFISTFTGHRSHIEHTKDRQLLHDAAVWMLAKRERSIRSLSITVPCLCSRNWEVELISGKTEIHKLETWLATFPPLLEAFAYLRLKGTVNFHFARQESFPTCPLRRCKALAEQLKGLKETMKGDSPRLIECPTMKYRCTYQSNAMDASERIAVDCECDGPEKTEPLDESTRIQPGSDEFHQLPRHWQIAVEQRDMRKEGYTLL